MRSANVQFHCRSPRKTAVRGYAVPRRIWCGRTVGSSQRLRGRKEQRDAIPWRNHPSPSFGWSVSDFDGGRCRCHQENLLIAVPHGSDKAAWEFAHHREHWKTSCLRICSSLRTLKRPRNWDFITEKDISFEKWSRLDRFDWPRFEFWILDLLVNWRIMADEDVSTWNSEECKAKQKSIRYLITRCHTRINNIVRWRLSRRDAEKYLTDALNLLGELDTINDQILELIEEELEWRPEYAASDIRHYCGQRFSRDSRHIECSIRTTLHPSW